MKFSDRGFELLKSLEPCHLTATKVKDTWCVGYNFTGKEVKEGYTLSQENADSLLREFADTVAELVFKHLERKVNQNEFDALVCVAYNMGVQTFSTCSILSLINSSCSRSVIANEFLRSAFFTQNTTYGIRGRREKERELFLTKPLHPLLSTSILAECDTWLKRKPVAVEELNAEEKCFVPKGCAHQWLSITMLAGRQHRLVVLEAQPDTEWYIWPPHWKIIHDAEPKPEDSPSNEPTRDSETPSD